MQFEIEKIGIKEWVKKEILRQLDKSVEQKMGEFHQMLLGGVDGWLDLKIGHEVDLRNEEQTIHIELKNKFNTCSSSALSDVRRTLENITRTNHKVTAYWAYIIANTSKKSGEDIWVKKGKKRLWHIRTYRRRTC